MFRDGYWKIARFRGAPLKLHWSIPLGAFVFGGFSWRPGFFFAFTCLVLIHELGHAWLVNFNGHRIAGIEVTGIGGQCRWSGNASPFEEALIAWGGVLAQLLLLLLTYAIVAVSGSPSSSFGAEIVYAFTFTNLHLIAINLLPIRPLDGARAWQIFRAYRERDRTRLPHGTWRDHSPNVQNAWFDALRAKSQHKSRADVEPAFESEQQLSSETQRALMQLLQNTNAKKSGDENRSED